MRIVRSFKKCPRCGAHTEKATSFSGAPSKFWYQCTRCNTFINTYIPQKHQAAVHEDPHTYIGNFGGFGTGKTLTTREEIYKHIFLTPGTNILIGAEVKSQYEQTLKRELEEDIPEQFVIGYNGLLHYMDLINGTRIIYRPLSEVDNVRSYNVSMFVMLEASECKANAFYILKGRLRNLAASILETDPRTGEQVFDYDEHGRAIPIVKVEWRRGIIESNPDVGWLRTDILYHASKIVVHDGATGGYNQEGLVLDESLSAHVAATQSNKFLPATYIQELSINKPKWWISRYIFSSFDYSEGLVYPTAVDKVIPNFEIPKEWRRIVAFDYGLTDDAVFLYLAIDEKEAKVYVYKEERTTEMNIEGLSKMYFKGTADIPSGGMICPPLIDPKSGEKRDYDKNTLRSLFLQQGIYFKLGAISIDARVMRLNTYLNSSKLWIMDNCSELIKELREYKFRPRTLDDNSTNNKPVDKNNHGINALEWAVMELPADPKELIYGVYNQAGQDITKIAPVNQDTSWQLRDEVKYNLGGAPLMPRF